MKNELQEEKDVLTEKTKKMLKETPELLVAFIDKQRSENKFLSTIDYLRKEQKEKQVLLSVLKTVVKKATELATEQQTDENILKIANKVLDYFVYLDSYAGRKETIVVIEKSEEYIAILLEEYVSAYQRYTQTQNLSDKEEIALRTIIAENMLKIEDLVIPYTKSGKIKYFRKKITEEKGRNEVAKTTKLKLPPLSKCKKEELILLMRKIELYDYDDALKLVRHMIKKYKASYYKERMVFFEQNKETEDFEFYPKNIYAKMGTEEYPYFPYKEQTEEAFEEKIRADILRFFEKKYKAYAFMNAVNKRGGKEFFKIKKEMNEFEATVSKEKYDLFKEAKETLVSVIRKENIEELKEKILKKETKIFGEKEYLNRLQGALHGAKKEHTRIGGEKEEFDFFKFAHEKMRLSLTNVYCEYYEELKKEHPKMYEEKMRLEAENFKLGKDFEEYMSYYYPDIIFDIMKEKSKIGKLEKDEIYALLEDGRTEYKKIKYMGGELFDLFRKDEECQRWLLNQLDLDELGEFDKEKNKIKNWNVTDKTKNIAFAMLYPKIVSNAIEIFFDEQIKDQPISFLEGKEEDFQEALKELITM